MYVYILCYKCTISLHAIRLKYYLVFVFVLVFVASFFWKKTPFRLPAHAVAVKFTVT